MIYKVKPREIRVKFGSQNPVPQAVKYKKILSSFRLKFLCGEVQESKIINMGVLCF